MLRDQSRSLYAQELIKNCQNIISDCTGDTVNKPVEVLTRSVARTQSPGSSAILIAHFDGQVQFILNFWCLLLVNDDGCRELTVNEANNAIYTEIIYLSV